MTPATARVLNALLEQPGTPRYGMELMELTGLRSGSLYPIMARLAGAGWVDREREKVDASAAGRPVRSYYTLTPAGTEEAPRALAAAAAVYWSPSGSEAPHDTEAVEGAGARGTARVPGATEAAAGAEHAEAAEAAEEAADPREPEAPRSEDDRDGR